MRTLRRLLTAPLFAAATLRAAARSAMLGRRHGLRALPARLRRVPPFRLRLLDDPPRLRRWAVRGRRLLPHLGPCWAQSLILLDLAARAGRRPRLCLGAVSGDGRGAGHAWVRADGWPAAAPVPWIEVWSG